MYLSNVIHALQNNIVDLKVATVIPDDNGVLISFTDGSSLSFTSTEGGALEVILWNSDGAIITNT